MEGADTTGNPVTGFTKRQRERFMTRGTADGRIERANPLNRIGRNMNPFPLVMLCLCLSLSPAFAQQPSTTPAGQLPVESVFDRLPGRWVRLQGGYVITIRVVE